ncbi:hypothetical protein HYX17_04545 [Candidatus Woesearchaeota archaeon]|nr:hypothetical protein [Candidatus Woesearchaeota archaeon]
MSNFKTYAPAICLSGLLLFSLAKGCSPSQRESVPRDVVYHMSSSVKLNKPKANAYFNYIHSRIEEERSRRLSMKYDPKLDYLKGELRR